MLRKLELAYINFPNFCWQTQIYILGKTSSEITYNTCLCRRVSYAHLDPKYNNNNICPS